MMDNAPPSPNRRRKGSLRKTVLLGVERLRGERRTSLSNTIPKKSSTKPAAIIAPRDFVFPLPNSPTESHTAESRRASTNSENASADENAIEANTHEALSPTDTNPSTISDDDVLTFPELPSKPTTVNTLDSTTTLLPPSIPFLSPSPSPPSSESSDLMPLSTALDTSTSIRRRRSTLRASKTSPLTTAPTIATLPPIEEEWDYTVTEWWGWVILFVTWIVFVVGMGSCFGVWSWTWDVGDKPYAPPELEDDPTLPIVGYYPALLVLTAVMSWVWVVVAWVGLKYFKHAKMGVVEDG